jgi:hypothetical protein
MQARAQDRGNRMHWPWEPFRRPACVQVSPAPCAFVTKARAATAAALPSVEGAGRWRGAPPTIRGARGKGMVDGARSNGSFPGWCHHLGRNEPSAESGMSLTICCKLPLSNLSVRSICLLDAAKPGQRDPRCRWRPAPRQGRCLPRCVRARCVRAAAGPRPGSTPADEGAQVGRLGVVQLAGGRADVAGRGGHAGGHRPDQAGGLLRRVPAGSR